MRVGTGLGTVFDSTNLEVSSFATLSAIRGKQFGREVFSTVIKFNDLAKFLEIFPQVQRDIVQRKVASIRRYILTGLENGNSNNMRFFSAVTVSCKGTMFYDETNSRVAINTEESRLSINDGQHRFEAIKTAIEYLEGEFVKCKDKNKEARIKNMIDELHEMVVPVVIFNGLSEAEEKQLFHDLNNLAQRPSRSANIRLNQTDLLSRMSREVAEENRYLKHYGVEYDKVSIHPRNPNTILLTSIYNSIKALLDNEYKFDKNFLTESNYNKHKAMVNETFDKMFFVLPPDLDTKEKYITDKSFTFKAICKFICDARTYLDLQLSDDEIFDIIKNTNWTNTVEAWENYGASLSKAGQTVFGGGMHGGYKAVYDSLMDKARTKSESPKE
ncbi:DGQHR domain-containing protein [Bacillus cereus]|uniref:DGQHR domain-containing protein n=1 Tax=Bacillus cereus TaxID=1396 RepID=A0ABD4LMC9_BACCE|nr:DGQHR domain-containing protein [Bacillus cereus]